MILTFLRILPLTLILIAGAGRAAELLTVTLGHTAADRSAVRAGLDEFAEMIGERSQGRISVVVPGAGALGDDRFLLEQVRAGRLEMAAVSVFTLQKMVPETGALLAPFVFPDLGTARAVLDDPEFRERLFSLFAPHGLVAVGWTERGFLNLFNSRIDVRRPKHCAGLQIRIVERPFINEMMDLLRMIPRDIHLPKLYDAVAASELDGMEETSVEAVRLRLAGLTPHLTMTRHCFDAGIILANESFWNGLAPADRDRIAGAAREGLRANRNRAAELEERLPGLDISFREYCRRNGITVIELDPRARARFRAAVVSIRDRWAKRVGEDFFRFFTEKVDRLSGDDGKPLAGSGVGTKDDRRSLPIIGD